MNKAPVCILGMHRSNTSMLAHMLDTCGLYIGPKQELIPASVSDQIDVDRRVGEMDNPEGYWEDARFVQLNDRIFEAFNGTYAHLPVFEADWTQDERLKPIRKEAAELVNSQPTDKPWAWKDPRTSVTLKFWRERIPDLRLIVMVRHPLEVAASFNKRSYGVLPVGMALDLWARYYEILEREMTGMPSIFTHADSYFYDPEGELRRIAEFIDFGAPDAQIKEAAKVVKPGLRRSSDTEFFAHHLSSATKAEYEELCKQCGPVYEKLQADPKAAERFRPHTHEEALAELAKLHEFMALKSEVGQMAETELARLYKNYEAMDIEIKRLTALVLERDEQMHQLNLRLGEVLKEREELQAKLDKVKRWAGPALPVYRMLRRLKRG